MFCLSTFEEERSLFKSMDINHPMWHNIYPIKLRYHIIHVLIVIPFIIIIIIKVIIEKAGISGGLWMGGRENINDRCWQWI